MHSPADLSSTTNSAGGTNGDSGQSNGADGTQDDNLQHLHQQHHINGVSPAMTAMSYNPAIVTHQNAATARLYAAAFGQPAANAQNTRCYSPPSAYARRVVNTAPQFQTNLFGGLDDSFFQHARAEAALVAGMDMKPPGGGSTAMLRPAEMFYPAQMHAAAPFGHAPTDFAPFPTSNAGDAGGIFDRGVNAGNGTSNGNVTLGACATSANTPMPDPTMMIHPSPFAAPYHTNVSSSGTMSVGPVVAGAQSVPAMSMANSVAAAASVSAAAAAGIRYSAGLPTGATITGEPETDPRELERFAEHFKQRRIKLGVTQADVGKALAHLKMPGVGSLSQSTICRFESLTLSHNNMVALKPILHSWLEKAEEASKLKNSVGAGGTAGGALDGLMNDANGILPNMEKKRKRTSIAAPEKRSLEAYFALQPRPSGEKIAAIAEKLDLKKNVVRVWFCNQRQKQKRWAERHHQLRSL